MKYILLLTTLNFVITIVQGQQVWEQKYDDKIAQTFTRTLRNKYVLVGSKSENMQKRWHIFQTDSMGTIEWDTTFLQGIGYPGCIEPTPDSGFIIAGGAGDAYFLKFNKNNKLDWESKIKSPLGGIEPITSVITTKEKGYLATGAVWLDHAELFIIKFNENGDSLWTKKYFSNEYGTGVSLVKSPNGTGYYCLAGTSIARTLLLKIDEQGDTIWTRKIHESSDPTSMILTSDTNLVISAVENSRNLVFTKVDLTGNKIWEKKYKSAYTYNHCNHIAETSDKGFITANYMDSSVYGEIYLWIMKLDEQGDSLFSITSATAKLWPEKIMETSDGFYVFLANGINQRPRLIKTDRSGSVITSIHSPKLQNRINLYPNPVQDNLTVTLYKPVHEKGFYRLFNSSGPLNKRG